MRLALVRIYKRQKAGDDGIGFHAADAGRGEKFAKIILGGYNLLPGMMPLAREIAFKYRNQLAVLQMRKRRYHSSEVVKALDHYHRDEVALNVKMTTLPPAPGTPLDRLASGALTSPEDLEACMAAIEAENDRLMRFRAEVAAEEAEERKQAIGRLDVTKARLSRVTSRPRQLKTTMPPPSDQLVDVYDSEEFLNAYEDFLG